MKSQKGTDKYSINSERSEMPDQTSIHCKTFTLNRWEKAFHDKIKLKQYPVISETLHRF